MNAPARDYVALDAALGRLLDPLTDDRRDRVSDLLARLSLALLADLGAAKVEPTAPLVMTNTIGVGERLRDEDREAARTALEVWSLLLHARLDRPRTA